MVMRAISPGSRLWRFLRWASASGRVRSSSNWPIRAPNVRFEPLGRRRRPFAPDSFAAPRRCAARWPASFASIVPPRVCAGAPPSRSAAAAGPRTCGELAQRGEVAEREASVAADPRRACAQCACERSRATQPYGVVRGRQGLRRETQSHWPLSPRSRSPARRRREAAEGGGGGARSPPVGFAPAEATRAADILVSVDWAANVDCIRRFGAPISYWPIEVKGVFGLNQDRS